MSSVTLGSTQYGKTFGAIGMFLSAVMTSAAVFLDPQASGSRELMKRLVREEMAENVLYERLSSPRCLGFDLLSSDDEEIARQKVWDAMMLLTRLRGINIHETPLIREFVELGLEVIQEAKAPFWWLEFVLTPGHPLFKRLRGRIQSWELQRRMDEMDRFSPHQIRKELSPAQRLVRPVCRSKMVRRRTVPSLDFGRFLDNNGILIVEGQCHSSDEEVAFVLGMIATLVTQYVKYRNGGPDIQLWIDEAGNVRNLIGHEEAKAFAMLKKRGLGINLISQTLNFDEEVTKSILQNSDQITAYRIGDPETATTLSEIISTANFSAYREHHRDLSRRQLHDGFDNDGKPQYLDIEEERVHYYSASEQQKLSAKSLMQLGVGQRYVIENGFARKEEAPRLRECWTWPELGEIKLEESIAKIIQRKQYHEPNVELKLTPQKQNRRKSKNSTKGQLKQKQQLSKNEMAYLQTVIHNPSAGVTKMQELANAKGDKGKLIREKLKRAGFLTEENTILGEGRPTLLSKVTNKGLQYLKQHGGKK